MKKCSHCGYDNYSYVSYCSKCGTSLVSEAQLKLEALSRAAEEEAKAAEANNAAAEADAAQAPVEQTDTAQKPATAGEERCAVCGSGLEHGAKFCMHCGTKFTTESEQTAASTGKIKTLVIKTTEFEKKHNIIVNALLAVCAIVIAFVALFAPVKLGIASASVSGTADGVRVSVADVDQSLWQIIGAVAYNDLDFTKKSDRREAIEFIKEYNAAVEKAQADYAAWERDNKSASTEAKVQKLQDLTAERVSEINYLAYLFVYTTPGVLNYMYLESNGVDDDVEAPMSQSLAAMRSSATISLIGGIALFVISIGLALVSLIFAAFAIVGMFKGKTYSLFAYLTVAMLCSGVALAVLSLCPTLQPGGAMFAIAIFSAIAMFLYATTRALLSGNSILAVIKRAAVAAFAVVAALLLFSETVSIQSSVASTEQITTMKLIAPLGFTTQNIIETTGLTRLGTFAVQMASGSSASLVTALIFGLAMIGTAYAAMYMSLRALAYKADGARRLDILGAVSILFMFLFCLVPAVSGSTHAAVATGTIGYAFRVVATAPVYVALGCTVAAFVFDIAYRASLARKAA